MKDGKNVYVSSLLLRPKGSIVWPLSMRYASLALRALSRLDLMSSRGISSMSEALWSLERKCSETVVGLELWNLRFLSVYPNDPIILHSYQSQNPAVSEVWNCNSCASGVLLTASWKLTMACWKHALQTGKRPFFVYNCNNTANVYEVC